MTLCLPRFLQSPPGTAVVSKVIGIRSIGLNSEISSLLIDGIYMHPLKHIWLQLHAIKELQVDS